MRNWKLSLLILSLALEGVLLTNWVYTVKADSSYHICKYITCNRSPLLKLAQLPFGSSAMLGHHATAMSRMS
jgi:hypothetical protein